MIKATRIDLTVVCFIGSKVYQKQCSSEEEVLELYDVLMNVNEDDNEEVEAVKEMFAPRLTQKEREVEEKIAKAEEDAENQKALLEWMEDIKNLGDEHFEVNGIKLYMKGINITVPEFLALEFANRRNNDEDFQSLMNFWRLCALNTDPRCREDLYKFLINNNLTVTPSGYFIAYRNVNVFNEGDIELNEFIVKKWAKIKGWKKSPAKYAIVQNRNGEYKCVKEKKASAFDLVGNLQELYLDISNKDGKTVYTDVHSGTTRIVIGQPVSIPRNECDANPDRTCSRGLHAANASWLSGGYFGNVGLAVLINPMNVVAVPYQDGGKLRCCEYLPICTIEYDEDNNVIPFETATFEYDYAEHTIEQLEEMVKTSRLEDYKEHEIIPKEIDIQSLRNILDDTTASLEEMNKAIESKVVRV